MRLAVTFENGQIFQHFGHTKQFKVFDIAEGKVSAETVVDTNGSGHGALSGFLKNENIDALICGGIGGGARQALTNAGIQLYAGVTGDADKAVEDLLANKLAFSSDSTCSHHDEHHGDNHSCGEHSCGEHSCGEHS